MFSYEFRITIIIIFFVKIVIRCNAQKYFVQLFYYSVWVAVLWIEQYFVSFELYVGECPKYMFEYKGDGATPKSNM